MNVKERLEESNHSNGQDKWVIKAETNAINQIEPLILRLDTSYLYKSNQKETSIESNDQGIL